MSWGKRKIDNWLLNLSRTKQDDDNLLLDQEVAFFFCGKNLDHPTFTSLAEDQFSICLFCFDENAS